MDVVIKKYIKLVGKESSAGEFACKLAREAYFGIDVMGKCTCNGSGDKPGLPKAELLELKETVRQTFPKYMGTHEFEIVWSKCQTSLKAARESGHPTSNCSCAHIHIDTTCNTFLFTRCILLYMYYVTIH